MRSPIIALCSMLCVLSSPLQAGQPPVRAELLGDDVLDRQRGRYLGFDMIVGMRIEAHSSWQTGSGGGLQASGAIWLRQLPDGGYALYQGATASAGEGAAGGSGTGWAVGGEHLAVGGIGQVTQAAGDGNRVENLLVIGFDDAGGGATAFNGQSSASAGSGGHRAEVSVSPGGFLIGLHAPEGQVSQTLSTGAGGSLMQLVQVSGNGHVASNHMQIFLQTATMPAALQQQLSIQQAMESLRGIGR